MLPRDRRVAADILFALCIVASVMTGVLSAIAPTGGVGERALTALVSALVCAAIVAGSWCLRFLRSPLAWAAFPFLGVVAIVILDLLTRDGTFGGQVFFFFPTLYAASQLKRAGALAVLTAVVAGDLVVLYAQLPARTATVTALSVNAALTASAFLLIYVSEHQARLMSQLEQLAAVDPLTGLSTRRVLDDCTLTALASPTQTGTALVLVDIDRFKQINDEWGHPGGDAVLVELAGLLRSAARSGDTVGRLGGDELALLLVDCGHDIAEQRAEQIVASVQAHSFPVAGAKSISVSVSAGVAHAPTHAFDVRSLYAAADAGLYAAKRAGRNRTAGPSAEIIALVRRAPAA